MRTFYRLSLFCYHSCPKNDRPSGAGVWGIVSFFVCAIVHLSKASAKAKGEKVKELQILAIVAIVTGFVWAGIGIIGQEHGLIQLGASVACVGMIAAVLSFLVWE